MLDADELRFATPKPTVNNMEAIPLPNQVQLVEQKGNQYTFVMEPLYPGYGVTVGNALRRVLLSSILGAAVVAVKMKWVDHEFSTIPNIKEDVVQIILNLKQLRLRVHSAEPVRLTLKVKGERSASPTNIKGNDMARSSTQTCTLPRLAPDPTELDMELIVQQGRGYVPVEQRENEKHEVGMIAVDAIYSPVKNANFSGPTCAWASSPTTTGSPSRWRPTAPLTATMPSTLQRTSWLTTSKCSSRMAQSRQKRAMPLRSADGADAAASIKSLNLSVRAQNVLEENGITTVAQLAALSAEAIAALEGLGEKPAQRFWHQLERHRSSHRLSSKSRIGKQRPASQAAAQPCIVGHCARAHRDHVAQRQRSSAATLTAWSPRARSARCTRSASCTQTSARNAAKVIEVLAPRFKERRGGYTRALISGKYKDGMNKYLVELV